MGNHYIDVVHARRDGDPISPVAESYGHRGGQMGGTF